jgi:hypothetical protein
MTEPHPHIESLNLQDESMDKPHIPCNADSPGPHLAVSMSDIERSISEREMLSLHEIGGHLYRQ